MHLTCGGGRKSPATVLYKGESLPMFLEQTINGLALGSVYALIAVGYSLIFGILRILNLAHSTFYAFAANILLLLISSYVGLIPALIIVVLLTGLLASGFDKFLLEPLRGRQASSTISLITAIGFSYVVENLMIAFFGSERRPFPNIFGTTVFKFAGVNVQISQIYFYLLKPKYNHFFQHPMLNQHNTTFHQFLFCSTHVHLLAFLLYD